MQPVLRQALRTFLPYAGRFGYDIHIGTGESGGRHANWSKILLLQRLLDQYDEILWLDADVVILDSSLDLADSVDKEAYQAFAEWHMKDGSTGLNNGVWFLRSGSRARGFLQAVWDSTEFIDHPLLTDDGHPSLRDNAAVISLLGRGWRDGGGLADSPWLPGTAFISQDWNMSAGEYGLRPAKFRHYVAAPNAWRERWIRADADRVEGRRVWLFWAGRRWLDRHVPRSRSDFLSRARRHIRQLRG
jgi:hypothetical protein